MSDFWPNGLDLSDTEPPKEILKVAQEKWHQGSKGILELVLQDAESQAGNTMVVIHAKHVASNRTSTLFTIVYRPNKPYPVTIQLEDGNLPNFLKKTYSGQSFADIAAENMMGKPVSNPWVSETPSEFRKKLAKAFNEGSVKSVILNLVSDASDDTNGDHQEDQKEI